MTTVGRFYLADVLSKTLEHCANDDGIAMECADAIMERLEEDGCRILRGSLPVEDSAWHSVWLHGGWQWLTRCMTTEERTAAAEAVERNWARIEAEDPSMTHDGSRAALWWWRS